MGYRGFLLLACFFAGSASATNSTLGSDLTIVAVDPSMQSNVYAASTPDGSETDLYRSTDWGVTWTFAYSVTLGGDLAIDPLHPSTLYLSADSATGSPLISKSTDGGITWHEADSGIPPDRVGPLVVDPVNEGVVYAAAYGSGLFKSTDGGQSWSSIDGGITGLTSEIYAPGQLLGDSFNPGTLYFTLTASPGPNGTPPVTVPSGLYRSTDGGATWSATGLTGVPVMGVTISPTNPNALAACANGTLESSQNGGTTWTAGVSCSTGPTAIAINPRNYGQIIFAGGTSSTLQVSSDFGATSSTLYVFPSAIASVAYQSGSIYVATSGSGLYVSRDSGATWNVSSSQVFRTIKVPADEATIQAAIDAADDGDTVLVSPGTYFEQLNFDGKAIAVKSSGGAAITTLDGSNDSHWIVLFANYEGNSSVLQGFTLTHFSDKVADGAFSSAVTLQAGSPTIEDNVFVDNTITPGGSVIFSPGSSAVIIRNYFAHNVGIDSVSTVVVLLGRYPVVADNIFVNNSAIACEVEGGGPQIYNNTMVGNFLGLNLNFLNSLPGASFSNNLIAFNQFGFANYGDADAPFSNNLVYGNTTDYESIPNQTGLNGNISADPQLKGWTNGDVHLLYGSPAIDSGNDAVTQASSTDFYGDSRVVIGNPGGSATVDIGAVEYVPPVVTTLAGTLQTLSGVTKAGRLGASGADSTEPLVFAVVTPPVHGLLTVTPGTGAFTYRPVPDYTGSDSFAFQVTDPYGTVSNTATEAVIITDAAPTLSGASLSTKPDTAVGGTLPATRGFAGQALVFSVVSNPTHGTVNLAAGTDKFTYTPATGFAGADSFTFQATDAYGNTSNIATVSVTVTDIAPNAESWAIKLKPRKTSYSGVLQAPAAYRGQTLTYRLVSTPPNGVVTITNASTGAYSFTALPGFKVGESFTFQAVDQWGTVSNTGTVTVLIF